MSKNRWVRRPCVPGGCVTDTLVVSALPDDWEPQQCGTVLNAYLNERSERHKDALVELETALVQIDDDVCARMRGPHNHLENRIRDANCELRKIIDQIQMRQSHGEIWTTLKDARGRASEQHACFVTDIARLRLDALEYEKERIERKRCVIYQYYNRLADIRHREPEILQVEKDSRFRELNKELSLNSNTWSAIAERLRSLTDDYLKEILLALDKITYSLLTKPPLQCGNLHEDDTVVRFGEKKNNDILNVYPQKRGKDEQSDDMQLLKIWIPRLLDLHSWTITKLVSGFCNHLNLLNQELESKLYLKTDKYSIMNFEDMQRMIEVATGHMRSIVNRKFPDSTLPDVITARRQGFDLEETLRISCDVLEEVYRMLQEAGCLWKDHVKRFGLVQKMILVRLEDRITRNDVDELAKEVGFNIELEQLRQSPDVVALGHLKTTLSITIDRLVEMSTDHCTEEFALLEELMTVSPVLGNLLLAEFECYFIRYPQYPWVNLEEMSAVPSECSHSSQNDVVDTVSQLNFNCSGGVEENIGEGVDNDDVVKSSRHMNSEEFIRTLQDSKEISDEISNVVVPTTMVNGPIAQALAETNRELTTLRNWRSSFLKSLQDRTTSFNENMTCQAEQWVHKYSMALRMRYAMKMLTQSVRIERIRSGFELRAAELQQHENQLSSHAQMITNSVEDMMAYASCFPGPDSTITDTLRQGIELIEYKLNNMNVADPPLDPEAKKLKLKSYSARLTSLRRAFEQSFDETMKCQREEFESRLRDARVSNMQFLSEIKLWSEGGRLCSAEASKFVSAVRELDGMVIGCSTHLEKAFSARRSELLSEADRNIAQLLNEFKGNGHQAIDNFKATLGKNKR